MTSRQSDPARRGAALRAGDADSIRARILVGSVLMTALAVVITVLANWFFLGRMVNREAEQTCASLATLAAHDVAPCLTGTPDRPADEVLAGLFQVEDVLYVSLHRLDGTAVAHMGDEAASGLRFPGAGVATVAHGENLVVARVPVRSAFGETLGSLDVGYSLRRMRENLRREALAVLGVGFLLACVALAVGTRIATRIVAPLSELARAARRVGRGEVPELPPVRSRDEVGQLVESFNDMAVQLRASRERLEHQKDELEDAVRTRTDELRRKNAALALQNERVLEVSRLKSEFLANMSHELRTPLNAILALSELLRDEITGPLDEEQKKQASMIYQSGESLLRLINDVLDLSKIEAGRMELRFAESDPCAILRESAEELRPLAERKGLDLRVDLEGEGTAWIDADRLRQVFVNLLGNAIKFTERGGVTVTGRFARQRLVLAVADTGPGIAPRDHEQVFHEFRQLDGSATRRYGGTGLGLAISRRLVRLMGGDVRLESELGHGATFRFDLAAPSEKPLVPHAPFADPAIAAAAAAGLAGLRHATHATDAAEAVEIAAEAADRARGRLAEPPSERPLRGAGGGGGRPRATRVLIVDDDPSVLNALMHALSREGVEVHAAGSGREALHELEVVRPDLLVLDLMMPGMSGFEVLERLTDGGGRPLVPVVVNTAKDLTREEWTSLEGKVERILIKGTGGVRLLVEEVHRLVDDLEDEGIRGGARPHPQDDRAAA